MLVFLWSWSNYLDPPVFLSNWRRYTIPVFIIFLAGQNFFVKGLAAGAVKG